MQDAGSLVRWRQGSCAAVVTAVLVLVGTLWSGTLWSSASQAAPAAARTARAAANPATGPVAPITAPGGPFLEDRYGRVVLMHGVNLVYKVAPYEVEVGGSGPNDLTSQEAQRMASLGFDVVRLGMIWRGLEPGRARINDPAICALGAPRASGSGQFSAPVFDAYLARLDSTIAMLARYGIYSVLDMHQDVYNEAFGGEGAPNWAVCTDGLKPRPKLHVPDWSVNLDGPGVAQAYGHFWSNDVVGNLQGEFDSVWAKVAAHYRGNPWVIGYDPFNEPYGQQLPPHGNSVLFDAELQCFYTGKADPGVNQAGQAVTCPSGDPSTGLIPRIEAADPNHLIFYEGNYSTDSGVKNFVGPMPYPRLVLNTHDYCFLHVPNGPEPPGFASTCSPLENYVFTERMAERARDATPEQPGGPALFLTEFGATIDSADLARVTGDADANLVGWTYWQWLHYNDPTGSHNSGLWPPTKPTGAMLQVLSRTYAQAVAGVPTEMSFDPNGARFTLQYTPDPSITEPTVVFVPLALHYPHGYCATVEGGRVTSPTGAAHLDVENAAGATSVKVSIVPGRC